MSRRDHLITALQATPRDLERLVRPLASADWRTIAADEAWCIADVVAHLADIERRFLPQLRRIILEDTPILEDLPPHPASHERDGDPAALLAAVAAARAETITFLVGLAPGDWARRYRDQRGASGRFLARVQRLVAHDTSHLDQIIDMRASLARQGG